MKKILSVFAILMMSMAIPQSVKAYDFSYTYQGQTLYYNIVNGEAQVTYQNNGSPAYTNLSGALVIPDTVTYNGTTYSVSSIGDYAFRGCSGLTSVTIPNSVTSIGNYAFAYCSGLTSVTIPNSVTSIGYLAFYGCSGLTSVTIPNSVTSIGSSAFSGCSGLTSVTIGNSVTSIDYMAFYGCSGLTSVTIPNSVTFIDEYAFSGCSGLTSVIFNADSCTSAGSYSDRVFDGCINITNFTFGNNVRVIPPYLCWGLSSLTSVTIPNSVTSIGEYAFSGCSGLIEVTMLGEIAPTLGTQVFYQNDSSRIIKIPCGSYDSYYNGSGWSSYRSALREPNADIALTLGSNDSIKGIASIIQHNGLDAACDSSAIISATSSYGYYFDHWSNGNTVNPDTLHLVGDSTVTAIFAPNQYVLTVQSADESLGTVAGSGTYDYLDTVTISATANNHHHFVYWSDGNRDNPRQVVVTCDSTIIATFAIDTHTVSVVANEVTRGTITGSGNYPYGTACVLTAIPYEGYTFVGWSNGVLSNPYAFPVETDVELTALFVAEGEDVYTVTVESADLTMGTVSGGGQAMSGGEVTIRAISNSGYHFLRWSDNSTDSVRTVTVTANATYTAYFEANNAGIDDADAINEKVYYNNGVIVVEGANGNIVTLYDVTGRMLISKQDVHTPLRFDVPASGTYMIKIGNYPARKIVVIR